ncbi:MAG: NUDIX domain-containing protein [Planctomycetota bacterium]|nr:NUDIX domain-containing protein [Planctomycetota bacterium]
MQLASSYRFCPLCGAERASYSPVRPFRCSHCGHTTFFGPTSAVGGIVTNPSGQVLLIRRAKDPGKCKLGMPGGFIDHGESAEEALAREIQEEVGIEVSLMRYFMTAPNHYVYQGVELPVLDLFFHVPLDFDPVVRAQESEVTDYLWTPLTDEVLEQVAFVSNRQALEAYRDLLS